MTPSQAYKLEQKKARYLEAYENKLTKLYTQEIEKVMIWFVTKYPKRRLKWVSGMGTYYWKLDGKILDCSCVETDFNQWNQLRGTYGCKNREPDRKYRKLMPLWDFYNSISDHSNVSLNWVDIGDFDSNDYKDKL
jgi:hypothetical protein